MPSKKVMRKEITVAKATKELQDLIDQEVRMEGNAFAPVLFVKGADFTPDELTALRASLERLGYAPEDWISLSTTSDHLTPLPTALVRQAVMTIDPDTVFICDDLALESFRSAFSTELVTQPTEKAAFLTPGLVVHVLGMRVLNLDNFAGALGDSHEKQVRWAYLKQVPPQGEPY